MFKMSVSSLLRGGHPKRLLRIAQRTLCSQSCGEGGTNKGLVLGVYQNEENELVLTPAAESFNNKVNGKLMDIIKSSKIDFTKGVAKVFNSVDSEFWAVAVVGLGKPKAGYNELEAVHEGMEAARAGAGMGSRLLAKENCNKIFVEELGHAEPAAEGAVLSLWRYQEFKDSNWWKVIPTVDMYGNGDSDGFQRGVFKAESQNVARRISDTPANIMSPLRFAQEVVNELCPCGIKVEVHDKDYIEHHHMHAFMAVARGSCEPPVFIIISYCGGPEEQKPIILCGKAITYDTGGLCLKNKEYMNRYRADLSGAAAIVGAMRTVAALQLPSNIMALIPVCENMISGMAMKVGDIIVGLNGKSIRVGDTDNEGRIILADAMSFSQVEYKPRLIIDVGTLTFGAMAALGSAASAVYTNSQTMWAQTRKAGILTGDRVWRMPLWKFYDKKVTNYLSHDVDNYGHGRGSSPKAAAFLNHFIECVDWIHFDTTGVGLQTEEKVYPYYSKGRNSGRPTRTLVQLLYQLSCPEEGARDYRQ